MRIVLASIHPTPLSGQIASLSGLAKSLERQGHQVTKITVVDGIRLSARPAHRESLPRKFLRMCSTLARVVASSDGADLVHINLPTPAFAIVGDLLQLIIRVPVVVGFEAHLAQSRELIRSRDFLRAPRFYIFRMFINNGFVARLTRHNARRYIVSSETQASELLRVGFPSRRIAVLSNVLDTNGTVRSDPSAARSLLNLPTGPLIAYAGHYHHVKGVDCVIDAFHRIALKRPECKLVLAWSGIGDFDHVQRRLKQHDLQDRVIQLGQVPITSFLSAIDVLVLPYRYTMGQHAFPALLVEALTLGVPIVTSDLPLLLEIVERGTTAILTPASDLKSIADGIEYLLADDMTREKMVSAQQCFVRRVFDSKTLVQRYERLYESVVQGEEGLLCQP